MLKFVFALKNVKVFSSGGNLYKHGSMDFASLDHFKIAMKNERKIELFFFFQPYSLEKLICYQNTPSREKKNTFS